MLEGIPRDCRFLRHYMQDTYHLTTLFRSVLGALIPMTAIIFIVYLILSNTVVMLTYFTLHTHCTSGDTEYSYCTPDVLPRLELFRPGAGGIN